MFSDIKNALDQALTRDRVIMYDEEGLPHATGTFPFLPGSTLHSDIPYKDEESLKRTLEMYQELGDLRR